jgi:predicted DNA-binding transcriptional regulator AlpA
MDKPAPLSGTRLLTTSEIMGLTGHNDRSAFHQWARRAGLPFIKLSARKIVYEESAVRAWLNRRTVGGAA